MTLPARYVFCTHGDSVLKLLRHRVQVKGFEADKLEAALEGAEVIVVPAGVPRKVRDLPI